MASNKWKAVLAGFGVVTSAFTSSLFALATVSVHAYEVVPAGGPNEYLKWGASKIAGTPGGVVTWGFLEPGTPGSVYCGIYCEGKSQSTLPNFYADPRNSNATTALALVSLRAVFSLHSTRGRRWPISSFNTLASTVHRSRSMIRRPSRQ